MKLSFSSIRKHLFPLILSVLLVIVALTNYNNQISFEEFTHSIFLDEVTSNTINLHYSLKDPSTYGIRNYDISLGSFSEEARTQQKEALRTTLEKLSSYSYLTLSTEEKLTYEVLEDYLNTQLMFCNYELYQEPLSASGGLHVELPLLFAEYQFHSEQDVKDYLSLIALTDEYFKELIDFEKEKAVSGLFMSDTQCKSVLESSYSFLKNHENHYLITTFATRLDELSLNDKKKTSYIEENARILESNVFPAYEMLITELSHLLGSGENELGLCHFDNGREYYELLVYAETGSADSVDDIFLRIDQKRKDDLLICAKLQENEPDIIERCASFEWNMTDPQTMVTCLQEELLADFPSPPDTSYQINYVDSALEEYLAPAFYIVAPLDSYLENTIYINNAYVNNDLYGFTTLAHESYPGHLYQTVMSYEYELPPIRSILNYGGYTEGWATYIEMMSYDYANLDENVASMLAHNQAASLSLYASSDIGLHYYGWNKEDMYAFWKTYGIHNKDSIDKITQLILSEPGNYLKYYVGYLEFLDLQDTIRTSQGDKFSLSEFHRTILDIGPAPFSLLEKYFWVYYSPQT